MPVIEHETHPSTQIGPDHRYGCWNREDRFSTEYTAPARRYFPDGRFEVVTVAVEFRMSNDCRFDGKNGKVGDDPHCAGCRHFQVSDYVKNIMEHGK